MPPTVDQIRREVADLLDRRRDHDPDRAYLFPDPGDLRGVVEYLARYQAGATSDMQRTEALGALRILAFLDSEVRARRLSALERARALGVPWRELAQALGVRSPQAAEQTMLRLMEAREGGPRSEPAARRRRTARPAEPREVGLARRLLKLRHLIPDDPDDEAVMAPGEWLDELADRLPGGAYPSPQGVASALAAVGRALRRRTGLDKDLADLVVQVGQIRLGDER